MSRAKAFISILMVLILIALSGASVWAAPNGEDPPDEVISGVIVEGGIVIEIDEETGAATVLVTLLVDETTGETQTVRLSLETAIGLGLVGEDAEGNLTVNELMIGETVEIDPSDVIEEDGEEAQHPVASALAEFFAGAAGLDYETIMEYHEKGNGFGLIAQACWLSIALTGDDASLFGDILDAKKEHNFSTIELPEGVEETPTNWGQFRKVVLSSDKSQKNLENLGAIMSGRAAKEQKQEQELEAATNQGQGKGKKGKGTSEEGGGPAAGPPGKSKDKSGEGGGPPTEPPGKGKDKEGGGPPAEPPGQDKGGGKDKDDGKDKGGGKGKGKG